MGYHLMNILLMTVKVKGYMFEIEHIDSEQYGILMSRTEY